MKQMRTVSWRGVTLGEGMPKIAVPVMGRDIAAIREAAARAARAGADIIELRLDSLSPMPDVALALDACAAVRAGVEDAQGENKAKDIPLLLTLRTSRDGGAGSADVEAYVALLCGVAAARCCEAIDCELSAGEAAFRQVVLAAHTAGVSVVGSSHAFTPLADVRVAGAWLLRQRAWGADVCKAAVMPADGLQALDASRAMLEAAREVDAPVIAICMGPDGVLSRVGAEPLGSCLTFATAGEASAPGQMDVVAVRSMLEALHAALSGR